MVYETLIEKDLKRKRGIFYTPKKITKNIQSLIKERLYKRVWVDLFCGEGNLLISILEMVPKHRKIKFFAHHILGYDIDKNALRLFKEKLRRMSIPEIYIQKNIQCQDTILNPPWQYIRSNLPIVHITNPLFLYKGYIPKSSQTKELMIYFQKTHPKLQDLYQVALWNDIKYRIREMIYIIPTNFLFSEVSARIIRDLFFVSYRIKSAIIFEEKVFDYTDTNVCLLDIERKDVPDNQPQRVKVKNNGSSFQVEYILHPANHWRAGFAWEEWIDAHKAFHPIEFDFYLSYKEIKDNPGNIPVKLFDQNKESYGVKVYYVNEKLANKIKHNHLTVRTLDTGTYEGRIQLFEHKKVMGVDGTFSSKGNFRACPIQLFFKKRLSLWEQRFIAYWFNYNLEKLRAEWNSVFLNTYRHTSLYYTRKIIGLNKIRALISTCPLLDLDREERKRVLELLKQSEIEELNKWIEGYLSRKKRFLLLFDKQRKKR